MAPLSPRRSSRARPTNSQSHQSSASSNSAGRPERNTRSLNKPASGKSTPSASLSSEPLDDLDDTLLGRRRKRGIEDDLDRGPRADDFDMATNNESIPDEEDEAVRCICGSEDYPGLPLTDGPDAEFFAAIELTEDLIGFFVQCDVCKVWQHGACVGIFSAEASPEEYFCEQCRKELHKIHYANNGQKYSKFLPLHRTSRTTSRATSLVKEGTRSPRSSSKGRSNSATHLGKRRSTMNSREAAYDDEQLKRAIEASRELAPHDTIEGAQRRPKRGRSDSEENGLNVKRQRTSSQSASPPPVEADAVVQDESDDGLNGRNGSKKARNGRPQREKTDKEDRDRQRQEAANKRKGRAERRRAEESDPSDEAPLASKSIKKSVEPVHAASSPDPSAQAVPDTPPPVPTAIAASSHKRGARSNHRKGKGKNQYTKERDLDNDDSPARSMSRDLQRGIDEHASGSHAKNGGHEGKPNSRSKAGAASKMSMLDMKRRVAAIMDFISRTQLDLAAEEITSSTSSRSDAAETTPAKEGTTGSAPNGSASDHAHDSSTNGTNGTLASTDEVKDFKDLSCMEMMDVLTRDMVKWQNQYA